MLLDLISSFFHFSFRFHIMVLLNKKEILWWFGGNYSINSRDLAIFMPNFDRIWSMVTMTIMFLDLFSSFFLFFILISQNDSYEPKKDIVWWFGGNWSMNSQGSVIFMLNFGLFGGIVIMTFRPGFFIFSFRFTERSL